MGYRLDWLEGAMRRELEPEGYRVKVAPGAATRGRAFTSAVRWVTKHHTASHRTSSASSSLRILMFGRPGLTGPLCHWQTERSGDVVIVATGRANHGGYGRNPDGTNPNSTSVADETENDGIGEPYTPRLSRSVVLSSAAACRGMRQPASHVLGHREVDPRRKIDPTYDMDDHRHQVARQLTGAPTNPDEEALMALTEETKREIAAIVRKELEPVKRGIMLDEGSDVTHYGSLRGWLAAIGTKLGVTSKEAMAHDPTHAKK